MHPTSQAIKTIIDNTPGYSVEVLFKDLGVGRGDERLLTAPEAADYLRVTTRTIYRWMDAGILSSWTVNQERRFKMSEVAKLVKRETAQRKTNNQEG